MLVALSATPLGLKLVCVPLLLGLAWRSVRPLRLQLPGSITALRESGEEWWLDSADGQGRRVILLPDQVLWRYLMVLRFAEPEPGGQRFNVPVLPDSLAVDDFRRLYVRLRWRRHEVADAAAEAPE